MPFAKGQSGNPGGITRKLPSELMRAVIEVKTLARQATPAAMATLQKIFEDPKQPGSIRIQAIEVVLDRGWGKIPAAQGDLAGVNVFTGTTLIDARQQALTALEASFSDNPMIEGTTDGQAHQQSPQGNPDEQVRGAEPELSGGGQGAREEREGEGEPSGERRQDVGKPEGEN